MAYGGKSYLSSLENILIRKDYASKRNNNASKPVKSNYSGTVINEPKPPPLKDNKPKKGFNAGTPCTSVAFTPTGKPSALSTVKDTEKYKRSTPGTKKIYNSGASCISTAFTPSGKSPAIRTVKQKDCNLEKVTNATRSPFKSTISEQKDESTAKYHIASERSQIVNTVNPKDSIPSEASNEFKPPCLKDTTLNRKPQSTTKNHISSETSSVVSTVNPKDFIQSVANNEFKPPTFIDTMSNRKPQSTTKNHISSERSSDVSTVNPRDFNTSKANNEPMPPSFDGTSSDKKHENTTKRHISSKKSTVVTTVNPKDHTLSKTSSDSKPPSFESTTSNRKPQSTAKYYISSERSPVVSTVNPKDFYPNKTIDVLNPLPLKNTASVTVHENMTKSYTPFKKSPAVSSVNTVGFLPRNTVHNSKLPPLKIPSSDAINQNVMKLHTTLRRPSATSTEKLKCESVRKETLKNSHDDCNPFRFPNTASKTVRQSIFTKYYSALRKSHSSEKLPENVRDLDYGIKKFEDPGSSHVPPNIHRGSTPVDLLRCIICIDKERDIVFQPCGHLIVCKICAKDVDSTCPMCRKRIKKKIKAYIT